jgi:serine/threonine protein kinase
MTEETIVPPPPVRRRIGPYELIREAGRGGMSTVYEAVDSRDGRLVAVKALSLMPHLSDEEQHKHLTRLQREADAVARLNHSNLVNVLDMGTFGDTPETRVHYLVMEYVNGEPLSERLSRTGPLPAPEAISIAAQIADALSAVHAAGVVHRDIKPGNIMLLPDGTAKLMDFGVARLTDDIDVTRPGTIIGSPAYMSPEQAKGEPTTSASDLWSFAAVLYAMLAGRSPFAAENIPATLYQVTHGIAGPIPNVPGAIMRVFARAFDRSPARRFPSAQSLSTAYEDALLGREAVSEDTSLPLPAPAVMPIAVRPGTKSQERLSLWVPLIIVAALTLSLFGASLVQQRRQAEAEQRNVVPPVPVVSQEAARPAQERPTSTPQPRATTAPSQQRTAATTKVAPTPRAMPTLPPAAVIVERKPSVAPPGPPAAVTTRRPQAKPTPTAVPIATVPTPAAREGTATSSLEPDLATPTPTPAMPTPEPPPLVALPAEKKEEEKEPDTPPIDSQEAISFLGTWRGTYAGHPALLVIRRENAESDTFNGTMTLRTTNGVVVLSVRGRLQDEKDTPEILLEERRLLKSPEPRTWKLSNQTGRLHGPDSMSGSGKDKTGQSYTWAFRRR